MAATLAWDKYYNFVLIYFFLHKFVIFIYLDLSWVV